MSIVNPPGKRPKLITKLKIGPALGSYANLFKPRAIDATKDPRYSIALLFAKDGNPNDPAQKSLKELDAMCRRVAVIKFGPDWESIPKFLFPIKDGDVEKPDLPEFRNKWFVNASTTSRPQIVDKKVKPILSEEEAYSGAIYLVSVNVFGFKNVSTGVALGLNSLLVIESKTAGTPRIDGRLSAAEEFAEYGSDQPAPAAEESPLD